MNVYQLINKLNNPFVYKYFATLLHRDLSESYSNKPVSKEDMEKAYEMLFKNLITLQPNKNTTEGLVKIRRYYGRDEITDFGYFGLDVTLLEDDKEYSIMASDWKDILGYNIEQESLEIYGAETCLYSILYEMTWFGWDYETFNKEVNRFSEELDEAKESGFENSISLDELYDDKELQLERPSKEEMKTIEEEFKKITEFNNTYLKNMFPEK